MRFLSQAWTPTRHTAPLTAEGFLSDGPRLIQLLERHYRAKDGPLAGQLIVLDDWQRALICHVLERYPLDWPAERLRGRLRYRQVVISLGRQNGKSILGAAFALYGLLQHVTGPSVVGIATSVEQANVVYGRVEYAVRHDPALYRRLKPSGTRGVRHRDGGGGYMVKPALEEGLQSVPITLCLADELHLSKASMWDSIVNGQRAQLDGLLVGITTAGDDTSLLLKRLYEQGGDAIAAPADHERFGFFLWEAAEGSTIDTPGAIEAANPAIACGRIDIETVRSDVRKLPSVDQQRYTLNRFVAAVSTWIPMEHWTAGAGRGVPDDHGLVVFAIDRTPKREWTTITATVRGEGGLFHTEVVASVPNADRDTLVGLAEKLARRGECAFVLDRYALGDVGAELKARGLECHVLGQADVIQACAAAYSLITQGRVTHAGDQLLTVQMPRAKRVNRGEGWRLNRAESTTDIDAVMATVLGLYEAEAHKPVDLQLF